MKKRSGQHFGQYPCRVELDRTAGSAFDVQLSPAGVAATAINKCRKLPHLTETSRLEHPGNFATIFSDTKVCCTSALLPVPAERSELCFQYLKLVLLDGCCNRSSFVHCVSSQPTCFWNWFMSLEP